MKMRVFEKNKGFLAQAIAFAMASFWVTACTSSNEDGGFAGGTTEDAGIIADLNVAGLTQKGPFVKGSAVTVQGIDCKTLKFTNELFEGSVNSDKGEFVVDSVTLLSTCAVFEVSGYYLNELSGKKSSEKLTLHALTNLKDRKNVNINVLTELEYERVMYLVTEKGETFAEAKKQAEKEVLASFNIKGDVAGSFDEAEDLNIFEKGDGNAALLAVSVMVQASVSEAKLAERLDEYSAAISQNGSLDKDVKKEVAEWATSAAANGKLDTIRKNIESWGYADEVPLFETYVKAVANGDSVTLSSSSFGTKAGMTSSSKNVEPAETSSSSGALSSGKEIASSSSSQNVILSSSEGSSNNTKDSYLNPNIVYGEMTDSRDGQVYKTVKIGNLNWMAQNLNYEAKDSHCYDDSLKYCDVYGRLYSWASAIDSAKLANDKANPQDCGYGKTCKLPEVVQGVCPDGWHLPTSDEWSVLFTEVGGQGSAAKYLKSMMKWDGTDSVGFSVLPAGSSTQNGYRFSSEGRDAYFWTATEIYDGNDAYFVHMETSNSYVFLYSVEKTNGYSVRCVEDGGAIVSTVVDPGFDWRLPKETYLNSGLQYDSIVDSRDGQVYKTVKIGDQVWMAQNLNYYDSVKTPSLKGSSWCYGAMYDLPDEYKEYEGLMYFEGEMIDACAVAGRLYTWAAAIDSVSLVNDPKNPLDCGMGKSCRFELPEPIRGICPEGFHLPTDDEWNVLFAKTGGKDKSGKALKSQMGWKNSGYVGVGGNGTDAYGFTAMPVGGRLEGSFDDYGVYAFFWSASEGGSETAYRNRLGNGYDASALCCMLIVRQTAIPFAASRTRLFKC